MPAAHEIFAEHNRQAREGYHGKAPLLDIPEQMWTVSDVDEDGRPTRLLTSITVNGCSLHLEAYAVHYVGNFPDNAGEQRGSWGVDSDNDEVLSGLRNAIGGEGPYYTVPLFGREFVLIATPYCR